MKVDVITCKTHKPFEETYWVSRMREKFTYGSDGEEQKTGH